MTVKQKMFAQFYVETNNATLSAKRAGYSENNAHVLGWQQLQKDYVVEYIEKLRKEVENNTKINTERVIKELARIAFFDVRKLYDNKGNIKRVVDLDEDTARAISTIDLGIIINFESESGEKNKKITDNFIKKVKAIDKKGALELLGKHLGMFQEAEKQEFTFEDWLKQYQNNTVNTVRKPLE